MPGENYLNQEIAVLAARQERDAKTPRASDGVALTKEIQFDLGMVVGVETSRLTQRIFDNLNERSKSGDSSQDVSPEIITQLKNLAERARSIKQELSNVSESLGLPKEESNE
ncbi:MAG: hypothetical protein WCX97_05540 [Candidatus Magasanikbacteria bacterium]